ncbi:Gfo/Idh/MocA family oxidoreductase [Aquisalimonas sp. 2447]|uniref:Gfo/Idh/MocA family protein n=1 Tax=Aquisalimonas sp. 2447 TaxID=2740807 RepID=UPI001432318A|nr:Gfo/Idh/MocA family oxidoreductase [Aquisalimonas sp. 2447]QIT57115.1 Gfo/Idh/MocA family oxidoreductase [Aquisalimonas sp. 2447]
MREDTFCWGIVGTGRIATIFAEDIQQEPGMEVTAVVSRSRDRGHAFAQSQRLRATVTDSINALTSSGNIDAIYIATPHSDHLPATMAALQSEYPVLCEKPMGLNVAQVTALADLAQKRGVFLMEAMWSRFLPAMNAFMTLLRQGAIGEPRALFADFGIDVPLAPDSRLFNPALGGGALLDVGVYTIALAHKALGRPTNVYGRARWTETGVDGHSAYTLAYGSGAVAQLFGALELNTPQQAVLCGTQGRLTLQAPFFRPECVSLTRNNGETNHQYHPVTGNGYGHEAREVADMVRRGRKEHPTMPLAESVAIAATMDELRTQWALQYPDEP